jgi:ABC-2 type transport system ATP-binding protein
MEEAERLCDRVAIIDRGQIIALGTPSELMARLGGDHVVEFTVNDPAEAATLTARLEQIPGVADVERHASRFRLSVDQLHRAVPLILAALQQSSIEIRDLSTRHASLEDVFVQITGRQFEESEPAA